MKKVDSVKLLWFLIDIGFFKEKLSEETCLLSASKGLIDFI